MLQKDVDRFCEILFPMLDWAKKCKVVKAELKTLKKDKTYQHEEENDLLTIIWKHPELIDQYLAENRTEISPQARLTLADWKKHFVPGPFIIERLTNMGAIFVSVADGNVYLVNGLTDSFEEFLTIDNLPCLVFTSLIPYNGCIVFDSTMQAMPTFRELLDDDALQLLTQIVETAKRFNTIIRRLPPKQGLVTNKQRDLMLKITQFIIKEKQLESCGYVGQASENSNIQSIPENELSTYEKLLRKTHRSQEDWDTIQKILFSGEVFTATPTKRTDDINDIEGVLCREDSLMVFTTLEKCTMLLDYLQKKTPSIPSYDIGTIAFKYAVGLAGQYKKTMYVDFPVKGLFKKCIIYDGNTARLSAGYILRH